MRAQLQAGLATLLLCSSVAPAPAQTIEGIEGITMLLATTFEGARLFVPGNTQLDEGASNTFIGFQAQVECSARINWESTVDGGLGLPCVPDQQNPPLGAGLKKLFNQTADECEYLVNVGAPPIRNTIVPNLQVNDPSRGFNSHSGVGFGNPGAYIPGGVCAPTSKGALPDSFVGWLLGRYIIIAVNVLSDTQCAYLVNMCTGSCSCGPFSHP